MWSDGCSVLPYLLLPSLALPVSSNTMIPCFPYPCPPPSLPPHYLGCCPFPSVSPCPGQHSLRCHRLQPADRGEREEDPRAAVPLGSGGGGEPRAQRLPQAAHHVGVSASLSLSLCFPPKHCLLDGLVRWMGVGWEGVWKLVGGS